MAFAGYDWGGRLAACKDLGPTHPTLARESPKNRLSRESPLHCELDGAAMAKLERIKEVARVRDLSIRTEQTYLSWCEKLPRLHSPALYRPISMRLRQGINPLGCFLWECGFAGTVGYAALRSCAMRRCFPPMAWRSRKCAPPSSGMKTRRFVFSCSR